MYCGHSLAEALLSEAVTQQVFSVFWIKIKECIILEWGLTVGKFVAPCSSWPIAPKSADRVICLAAAYNIQDLSSLYLNIKHVLRPGGIFYLADVAPFSGVQVFLESFVHRYTPGGHRSLYRDFFSEAFPSFFEVLDISRRPCP